MMTYNKKSKLHFPALFILDEHNSPEAHLLIIYSAEGFIKH